MTQDSSTQHSLFAGRVFPVKRERVFQAFTEAELLRQWWGPKNFSVSSVHLDVRPGGEFRIEMQAEAGQVFGIEGRYREVVPPEKLVLTWRYVGIPGVDDGETLVTIRFLDHDEGTELLLKEELLSAKAFKKGKESGWQQSLEKLATALGGPEQ